MPSWKYACHGHRGPTPPLALTVLSLLAVGPLHPYGIQRLIKLWGKDQVVNVGQRANLYRVITAPRRRLVAVRQTERDQQFPERTVYELTEAGRRRPGMADRDAVRPRNEFPEFPAALSFLMLLIPISPSACAAGRDPAPGIRGAGQGAGRRLATLPRVTGWRPSTCGPSPRPSWPGSTGWRTSCDRGS